MRVLAATVEDVDDLAALETEALGVDAWSPGLLRAGIVGGLPTIRYLVARADSDGAAILGYAVASLVADVAELQRIAVTATDRRTGVASVLLAAVDAEAHAVGSERLLLEVREDNADAQSFYGARGFVEIARRRNYYADGSTAVVMERAVGARTGSPE